MELWTIGHSTHGIAEFLALLKGVHIATLADVRRFPGSRRHPHFNSEALANHLGAAGIQYIHLPELGGRRPVMTNSPNTGWENAGFRGYADYMLFPEFGRGLARLIESANASRTAIMCAESLWWQCHRGLIADALKAAGHTVWHILPTGKVQEHPYTSPARIVGGKLCYRAQEQELPFSLPDS